MCYSPFRDGISIILNGYVNEPDNRPSSSNIKKKYFPAILSVDKISAFQGGSLG